MYSLMRLCVYQQHRFIHSQVILKLICMYLPACGDMYVARDMHMLFVSLVYTNNTIVMGSVSLTDILHALVKMCAQAMQEDEDGEHTQFDMQNYTQWYNQASTQPIGSMNS